jgi:NADPH-dependent curcumin reductase CurA
VGQPTQQNFEMGTVQVPEPGEGQIQVKNHWMTVDPYMRGRMNDVRSYSPPFELGEAMTGGALGQVIASRNPAYKEGDLVTSMAGWREAWTAAPQAFGATKLPPTNLPPQVFMGALGMTGLTAYAGLLKLGEPKSGETVFVSGAAGAVGSMVVQIARIKGCNVVASAGGKDKCDWVRSLGADAVIDYKTINSGAELSAALRAAAPKGIDVYFDNVGGDHLTAAIDCANLHARMPICGMISIYNNTKPAPGPHNLAMVIGKRLKIWGFLVSDHFDMQAAFQADMSEWMKAGKIKYEETIMTGIEKAPDAFLALFSGGNTGKMLVKLA